ncbi:YtxH domain-containing protein [Sediminibacillus albus]|uniref:Gas vesicle protein n=1 Tax=Sediminibacillus albus TaxID=407036 RepID=A0A1G8Y450_9BACI|nr:YtxH domain-containing protein [Sediminibacillus albus]SDJ97561.1 Gas vesicle protein [Sediminibacillus albus]
MSEHHVKERIKQKKDDLVNSKVANRHNKSLKMKNSSPDQKFVKGAVIGTAIGAAVSLISSPKSGKEVRGKLGESYGKTIDKGKQVIEKVESLPEEVELWSVQKTDELADGVINKAEKLKGKISENYEYENDAEESVEEPKQEEK